VGHRSQGEGGNAPRARSWAIFEQIATGEVVEATPENMRAMLPELEGHALPFRYRTAKRLLGRALGIERKQAGPILVGRRDSRRLAAKLQAAHRIAADALTLGPW
jgi:hypothetical protein